MSETLSVGHDSDTTLETKYNFNAAFVLQKKENYTTCDYFGGDN